MAIVTISRQLGAGGYKVASGVAKALGLRIIDREAIDQAALEAGVPEILYMNWVTKVAAD